MTTLAQAEAQLEKWLDASLNAAEAQETRLETGRAIRRAEASEIRAQIQYWTRVISTIKRGSRPLGRPARQVSA